jgi:hypothetical protein
VRACGSSAMPPPRAAGDQEAGRGGSGSRRWTPIRSTLSSRRARRRPGNQDDGAEHVMRGSARSIAQSVRRVLRVRGRANLPQRGRWSLGTARRAARMASAQWSLPAAPCAFVCRRASRRTISMLKLYNTQTRRKEEFEPLQEGLVTHLLLRPDRLRLPAHRQPAHLPVRRHRSRATSSAAALKCTT